jgi:membrane-bound lytic murein transglycosylase D
MRVLSPFSRLIGFLLVLNFLVVLLPPLAFPAQETPFAVFEEFPLPESVSLCGEPIPLENRCVWEMLDRQFTIAVWDHAQVFMWLKRAGRYFPYMEETLAEMGMPEDLKYVAVAESSLLTHARSGKEASGPWQFMRRTARRYGLRTDSTIDERLDFERSTEAALKFLQRLKGIFNTWSLALAAYNCGEASLKKQIKNQKVRDFHRLNLPLETERYIFRIVAIKIIMEDPERYGYSLPQDRIYRPIKHDTVPVTIRIPLHITDVARSLGTDFKVLKELNPHILGDSLPTGRYRIKVPPGLGTRMACVLRESTRPASRGMNKVSDRYYVVRPGDTLSHIAWRTGVPVVALREFNGIAGSLIRAGQKLRLTPK